MASLLRQAEKSSQKTFSFLVLILLPWAAHWISVSSTKTGSTALGFSKAPSTLTSPSMKLKIINSVQTRGGSSFSWQNQETARLG